MANETRARNDAAIASDSGPFLAKIVGHLDPTYMGSLQVEILRDVGNDEKADGQLRTVKYLSPFYGSTGADFVKGSDDLYDYAQKSYGMWMIPPDVGSIVICLFINGEADKGYWIGCVQNENMNFMVPGIAATAAVSPDGDNGATRDTEAARVPVSEYNKKIRGAAKDPTKIVKPEHPFAKILDDQGLLEDDIRGITTSSARREVPSAVFGISTPGPVDKQSGALKGKIGTANSTQHDAFVSRLGGSSFVMDDGDDKFLRKTSPSDGPPEYASLEQDETSDEKTRLHNELIRLKTRSGHQILMHTSEDLIYIGNARGTAWIELTSDGKIDIFAADSVSIHTKNDLNFYADRDINFEAGRNMNIKVAERHHTEIGKNNILMVGADNLIKIGGLRATTIGKDDSATIAGAYQLNTTGNNNFTSAATTNIKSVAGHVETAPTIHMNGPGAASATTATLPVILSTYDNPKEDGSMIKSIMKRIPSHEPWPHHENLAPTSMKPANTDREVTTAIASPTAWKKYSTKIDTFQK